LKEGKSNSGKGKKSVERNEVFENVVNARVEVLEVFMVKVEWMVGEGKCK